MENDQQNDKYEFLYSEDYYALTAQQYQAIKDGSLPPGVAKEMSNVLGKVVGLAKVDLEHAKLNNCKKKMEIFSQNMNPIINEDK